MWLSSISRSVCSAPLQPCFAQCKTVNNTCNAAVAASKQTITAYWPALVKQLDSPFVQQANLSPQFLAVVKDTVGTLAADCGLSGSQQPTQSSVCSGPASIYQDPRFGNCSANATVTAPVRSLCLRSAQHSLCGSRLRLPLSIALYRALTAGSQPITPCESCLRC